MTHRRYPARLVAVLAALAVACLTCGTAAALPLVPVPSPPSVPHARIPIVVGGSPTSTAAHPWVVALVSRGGSPYCGGTLVAPDKVVTAAHCVDTMRPDQLRVVAGRTDMRTRAGVVTGVSDIWVHPQFERPTQGEDIAVVTLDRELPYGTIPLSTGLRGYQPGTMASVFGWGYTTEGGEPSPVLQQARVPIVSDADCAAAYEVYDPYSMVCAGYPQGGVDACRGDSGGPLVVDGRLIGVVSFGTGCARPGKPGVYTRVSSYAGLVRQHLDRSRAADVFATMGAVTRPYPFAATRSGPGLRWIRAFNDRQQEVAHLPAARP